VGRHVTIAGSGTKAVLANSAGTPTSVALHDTVVAGTYDQTVVCAAQANGAASVGLSYSSYPAAGGKLVAQPGCSLTQGAGNEPDVAPLFAGLGHRPRAISPLVDAGTPNDPVATDLTAFAHVGGRSDIGAYEYLRRAPSVTLTAPAQALAGTAVDLAATATDPDVLEAGQLTYAWDFGDGQTGTGKTQSHAWTAGGTYTVTATATDPAGETSTASQAVAVADPPAPPTDPGQPPADPGQNPGPGGQDPEGEAPAPAPGDPLQAATDQIAPKLSRLALRRGKVTFRLSEAARVTVKAGRVKRTVHARAGRTTLQLKGVRGGRVRLKVSVVDAAGNRAAASRVVKM
ncbi:MAG TPA: PKD domain-containing protein, partial [Solirubrobacteraceae bacterium]|nr:PKD domain-containing protein [Solirubrobacteraceae bacterium]